MRYAKYLKNNNYSQTIPKNTGEGNSSQFILSRQDEEKKTIDHLSLMGYMCKNLQ